MKTMHAIVMDGPRQLQVREFPKPTPGPGEVLVRIRACALCTWEQRSYTGQQANRFPFVGGHEFAGIVEAVGEGISPTDVQVGDHVAPGVTPCGHCYYCRRGLDTGCKEIYGRPEYAGIFGPWGLSEYKIVPLKGIYKLAPDLPLEEGALSEPLSCAIHGIKRARITLGEDVVVIGAGPMGLLNMLVLQHIGARVIMAELDPGRAAKAKAMGAAMVINPAQEDPVARIKELTDGRGADAVIIAHGSEKTDTMAYQMVRKLGRVVLFAAAHPPVSLGMMDHNYIHNNELEIIGTVNKDAGDFALATRLLSERIINVKPLVSELVPYDDPVRAFERSLSLETYRVVVTF